MLGEEFGHLGLDRLRQQGARSVAQHLGKRVGERPWLKQLDDVSIGHGVSLLCWRSGGSNTPTIRRLLPVRPSPTSAHSSREGEIDMMTEPQQVKTTPIILEPLTPTEKREQAIELLSQLFSSGRPLSEVLDQAKQLVAINAG